MKKLLIGLVLCAGMSQGQTLSISTQIDSVKYQTRSLGDTVKFNVYAKNEKSTDHINVSVAANGICTLYVESQVSFKEMKFKMALATTPVITVYECYVILSKSLVSSSCKFPRLYTWVDGGSKNESVIAIQQPTGIEDSFLNESESKVVAMYDLQGSKVDVMEVGKVVIAVYSDGRRRKIVMR